MPLSSSSIFYFKIFAFIRAIIFGIGSCSDMKLLYHYILKYKKTLFLALGLATINQLFSLVQPQLSRILIDKYATQVHNLTRTQFLHGILLLLLAGVAAALISRIAKNFQDYFVNVITQKVGTKLYADSIEHAFALPYSVFEDQRSGELLQKVQKARLDSQNIITSSINTIFLSLVTIVVVMSYAFYVNWVIGTVFLSIIPILGGVGLFVSKRIREAQKKIVRETANLAGSTTETLRNVELVKSLGLESQETDRLNNVNLKVLELELKKVKLIRMLSFVQGSMVNLMSTALQFLLLWFIFTGSITLGQYFSLLFYSFFVFQPLYDLGNVMSQYQEAKASLGILDEVLKMPKSPKPENPKAINTIKTLAFNTVSFMYQSASHDAIKDISFNLTPGETAAFVGPSGSGKTTVLKILVGLYTPTGGEMLINDIAHNDVDFEKLRKRIGYVSQDTQLFAGTIRDNLLFVKPDATDAECDEAIAGASATSILERAGQGLDTKIGEGGIKISGGERQRLAIARALLRKPEILIFDEATSSLDSMTEKEISKTIAEIGEKRKDIIMVLVAHRLSTVRHADTIYVLEKGHLEESGSHDDLLQKAGLYSALWRSQTAEKEA